MEENIKLEKEYKIPVDVFREGFKAYQKMKVLPKSWIFIVIFLVLTANFVYGAVKAPDNYFAYLLIAVCLFMAVRQWYNPRKARRSYVESFADMGEPVYRISVADSYAEIATVSAAPAVEAYDSEGNVVDDPLPEAQRLEFGSDLSVKEGESFFLLINGESMVYIVPKAPFDAAEQEILRNIGK